MGKTIINSTIALTSAFLLTIILHELAHYVMSVILGYDATLFHNRVITKTNGKINHEIMIAGIAPVFSLLLGIIAYFYSKAMRTSPMSLFVLWLGVAGIYTFFGYLMIAPLIPVGDTGKVFYLMEVPIWIQIVLSIVAITFLTIFLIKSTNQFERYAIEDFGSIKENRKKWSISLILIPLLLSILVSTAFQFPIPHIISILATICAPFSIMAVFGTFIGRKNALVKDIAGVSINDKVSVPLIIIFALVAVFNRFLVNGI